METKHTPTPWGSIEGGETIYVGPEGLPIGYGFPHAVAVLQRQVPNSAANAAFIVKACNHHDEMAALLERIVSGDWSSFRDLSEPARALLAKLKGK